MDLRGVPLSEIRSHLLDGEVRVTRAELEQLRGDGRAGARDLARRLEEQRRRRAAERRRVSRLFRMEREYRERGFERVAGVDEVGVGPLAGPVVAAAVILPARVRLDRLDDSKKLTARVRERLDREIRETAVAVAVGLATREEIDELNIYHAGVLAMYRAVRGLSPAPGVVLSDARSIPDLPVPQRPIKGGDASVGSIAAASIVAKVCRDGLMRELDRRHPGYGFVRNNGYGTAEHLRALRLRGPTPEHRRSFAPVAESECPTS